MSSGLYGSGSSGRIALCDLYDLVWDEFTRYDNVQLKSSMAWIILILDLRLVSIRQLNPKVDHLWISEVCYIARLFVKCAQWSIYG